MPHTTVSRITEIRTVGVPSADQDRALEFYVGVLGFEVRLDAPFGPGLRWIEVAPRGAATSIAITPLGPNQTTGVDTGIRLATSDARADHAGLAAAGVNVDDVLDMGPGVPPMFTLRDPDGNTLYVVERD